MKTYIISYHKKGETRYTYLKDMQAKSREDLEKQAKKRGIVIDKAVLKVLEVGKK